MGNLPIRPIIVVEAHPQKVERNQMIHLSARFFDKKSLALMEVSRIYMFITSLKDGHTVWPLEVIRKDASGFDIGIGTQEMKEGHDYLVRVSNNWNLSPSAATIFTVKETPFPVVVLLPIIFSPLFIRKYQDRGIRDVDGLTAYLKSQGFSDEQIKTEINRILQEVELEENVRIPIDLDRKIINKRWITQMDHRVCFECFMNSISGENLDGVWKWDDTNAPEIPEHPNCRCTYDLEYAQDVTEELRTAATMAGLYGLGTPLNAIKVISSSLLHIKP
ncbi:MAG: hypothetical protein IIC67_02755 [Thaumarchaeota archaeon]|nr:hypothetical protein [Nitrososphaerota archaeon]